MASPDGPEGGTLSSLWGNLLEVRVDWFPQADLAARVRPIVRLDETVVNRIAAGEASLASFGLQILCTDS